MKVHAVVLAEKGEALQRKCFFFHLAGKIHFQIISNVLMYLFRIFIRPGSEANFQVMDKINTFINQRV